MELLLSRVQSFSEIGRGRLLCVSRTREHFQKQSKFIKTTSVLRTCGPRATLSPTQGVEAEGSTGELSNQDLPVLVTPDDVRKWRWSQLRTMLAFMGPAACMPLGDPLMSVVDCICIGQYATLAEVAALGPNGIIFSFFQYLLTGLCTATVSEVTTQLKENNHEKAGRLLATALIFAAGSGTVILCIIKVFGQYLIPITKCPAELYAPAWSYMRVRAFAAPAVLIVMVAQAGLLAQKDSRTPLLCMMLQCLANVVGDIFLVKVYGMGLPGAAWATVAAQVLGAAALLMALYLPGRVKPAFLAVFKAAKEKQPSGKAAAGEDLQDLGSTFGPATILYLCKTVCYFFIQENKAGSKHMWEVGSTRRGGCCREQQPR
eukprot:jgi/Botrbrau1/2920/Bobra.0036s0053.2